MVLQVHTASDVAQESERSAPRFDQLDRKLIGELRDDPRVPYATLGTRLGVTGMTAANRLARLRNAGLIRMRAVPNFSEFGLTTDILGLVQADMHAIGAVIDVLKVSPFVLRADRVTGEFDITFEAVFPSEAAMGALVREVQGVDGVRRLVVHHRMETLKAEDGWSAVWAETEGPAESPYEVVPGTQIPRQLETMVAQAALWVTALAEADHEKLRRLSTPDIVFTILPPHPSEGTFDGLAEVDAQADRTRRAYQKLWYRIVAVSEHQGDFPLVIDALSPVEDHRGRVSTAFSRMAFAFADGRIRRVMSLGQMNLPEVPVAEKK